MCRAMSGQSGVLARVRREVADVCHRGLGMPQLKERVLRALAPAVPVDAAFFGTIDPDTLLITSAISDPAIVAGFELFFRNELFEDDRNKFVELARARPPVAGLFGATGGRLEDSPRYREIIAPLHLGDELRVVLVSGGSCWGCMCLHREAASPPFTSGDATFLASLAPVLAEGVRGGLLARRLGGGVESDGRGPGLIVLGPGLELAAATEPARAWLEQLAADEWPPDRELPAVVQAVAARLRSGADPAVAPPWARVRARSGVWLRVRATYLAGPLVRDGVAVTIEEAPAPEVLPLIARTHELTAREAELVRYVARGLSTSALAAQLHISEHTVQDHLKSVFDKVGVRSRRELVAQLQQSSVQAGGLGSD
jgi:DNA-binding CsgD family transcriptional regulator